MALAVAVGAFFNTSEAAGKKKKEQPVREKVNIISLSTASDTLSYVSGIVRTDGLIPFIRQQYGVDSVYMADFLKGYEDIMAVENPGKAKAYAAGQQIALMVKERMLPFLKDEFKTYTDSINDAMFHLGFTNALKNDTSLMNVADAKTYFNKAFKQAVNEKNAANRKAGEDFLAANKTKSGVMTTASGLQYKVITEGKGELPKATDEIVVKYEGRLIDGTVFDSSYKRQGETAKFRPDQVIKGWTEALTMMPVGSKWELYIPQELAYGERQMGNIKPYSTLIFTVEVVNIEKGKSENSTVGSQENALGKQKPKITPKKKR